VTSLGWDSERIEQRLTLQQVLSLMSEYFAVCQNAFLCFVRITGIALSLTLAVFSSYFQTKVSPVRSIVNFRQCFIRSRRYNMVVYFYCELRVTASFITEAKFPGCLGA
jgi:hypothetical protein